MASDKILVITNANFEEEVIKSDKPVMVDFWAPWCGPCRTVGPIMDELAAQYEGKAKVGKLNVDENGVVAQKFNIMSIPTVIVFKNGEVADKIIGARSKEEFIKILDKNL